MKLNEACQDILNQLLEVIENIKDEDFVKPVLALNNATIGQHIRHTLEFFTCLKNNINSTCINYDHRDHDKIIETDRLIAIALIKELLIFVSNCTENIPLTLKVNYSLDNDIISLPTNLFRELTYNIEHAIHHMAIMKIGIKEVADYITLPNHFGVAISTIKYQQQLPVAN